MTVAAPAQSPVSEDKLIDVLRGCEETQQFLHLRDQLAKDPANPPCSVGLFPACRASAFRV